MTWSFQIGKLFGIPLRIHVTFFLLLLLVAAPTQAMSGVGRVSGVLFVVALFACVIIHELAHSLMARKYGVPVRYIILLPIGGVAMMERMPDDPHQELNVAVVGPLASLGIAIVLTAVVVLMGGNVQTFLSPLHAGGVSFVARLAWVNIMLAGFNILPAFPMDGGRVLRALLAERLKFTDATRYAAYIGRGLGIVMAAFGIFYNFWLVIIGAFIYMGATEESEATIISSALAKVRVRDLMHLDAATVKPEAALSEVLEIMYSSRYHDAPIVKDGALQGVVCWDEISKIKPEQRNSLTIQDLPMKKVSVYEDESILEAYKIMMREKIHLVPVVDRTQPSKVTAVVTSYDITFALEKSRTQ